MKYIILVTILVFAGQKSYADEFPWVQQIELQDSITWIRTNEGLYRIIFHKNGHIDWDKITEGSGKIFIDSKKKVWISNLGENLQVLDIDSLISYSNDTTKYVYDIFEFEGSVYIKSSIHENEQVFKVNENNWETVTDVPKVLNTSRNHSYNMEKLNIELPDSIRLERYNYNINGDLWILSRRTKEYIYDTDSKKSYYYASQNKKRIKKTIKKGGTFYKYEKEQFVEKANFPFYNRSVSAFTTTVNDKVWIGGYSYVSFFDGESWIEFSILPEPVHFCGSDDEEYHEEDDGSFTGFINDPDGYTNVRKEMKSNSIIIAKVLEGVPFKYWVNENSNWYKVVLISGTKGYIHKSRIDQ